MPKKYQVRALSSKVLAVASFDEQVGDWAVFIDAVAGIDHEAEFMEVAKHGDKLSHDLARVLFPSLDQKYRWRD
jgi:hypothetical protein